MLCSRPIQVVTSSGLQQVGCGQCFNCTINKRREWTARILLEGRACQALGGHVTWTTLTYAEDNVPTAARGLDGQHVRTLRKADYQRVFKLLRKPERLGPFRFAICGEYGERSTKRPHFHVLFFGPVPGLVDRHLQEQWAKVYGFADAQDWRFGKRAGQDASMSRAAYIAGYVVKKMHQPDHLPALDARIPEFFRCSQSPPLGYSSILMDLATSEAGAMYIAENGDVPSTVRLNGKLWPLGQTIRKRLREDLGIPQLEKERHQLLEPSNPRQQPTAEDYHRARQQSERLQRLSTKSNFGRL